MKTITRIFGGLLCLALLTSAPLRADEALPELLPLQEAWARTHYQTLKAEQEHEFELLVQQADALIAQHPERAEPLVWKAIILSTEASVVGGFSALDKVKRARDLLLKAETIDATALNGSVYTSLGSLYYKVPGWPIGFGDKDKARPYLEKALSVNPAGIDPNYFYTDYLFEQGHYIASCSPIRTLGEPATSGSTPQIQLVAAARAVPIAKPSPPDSLMCRSARWTRIFNHGSTSG